MSVTILQRQPRVILVGQAGGVVKVVKQMIAGSPGATGATGATGAAGATGATGATGPNSISDTTALGMLTAESSPLFLLASQPGPTPGFVRKLTPGAGTGGGLSLLLAADRAAVLALLGTGTDPAHFLRRDGVWAAVNASPGGSSGQLQWNSGGAFAGAAAMVYATTGTHLAITGQSAGLIPLTLRPNSADTGTQAVLRVLDSGGGSAITIETLDNYAVNFQFHGNEVDFNKDGSGTTRFNGVLQVDSLRKRGDSGAATVTFPFAGTGAELFAVTSPQTQSGWLVTADPSGGTSVVPFSASANSGYSGDVYQTRLRSSTAAKRETCAMGAVWADSTDATRSGRLLLTAYYTTTAQEGVRVEGNSGGVRLGLYGVTAVARQTAAADATDLATAIALVNDMKSKLITLGALQ